MFKVEINKKNKQHFLEMEKIMFKLKKYSVQRLKCGIHSITVLALIETQKHTRCINNHHRDVIING